LADIDLSPFVLYIMPRVSSVARMRGVLGFGALGRRRRRTNARVVRRYRRSRVPRAVYRRSGRFMGLHYQRMRRGLSAFKRLVSRRSGAFSPTMTRARARLRGFK